MKKNLIGKSFTMAIYKFIKPGIQEWGTECGESSKRGECSHFSIPRNVREDSGEYY